MGAAESGAGQDAHPTLADVYRTDYQTLFRLAALLTGDTGTAEAVVLDSFADLRPRKNLQTREGALRCLRRQVVTRSRRAAHRRRAHGGRGTPAGGGTGASAGGGTGAPAGGGTGAPAGGGTGAPAGGGTGAPVAGLSGRVGSQRDSLRFENSAVVLALRTLSAGQREAVVLKLYLDLTDEQAAAAMRLSQAALRRHLAAAQAALRGVLPPSP
jgi:DNA-directed RNA polymerase specialized sigma24 family protein